MLISTRSHGRIDTTHAMLGQFNYLLAHVNIRNSDLLLDGTDPFAKLGMVPFECLNQKGFLLHPDKPRFIEVKPLVSERVFEKADLVLVEEGVLTGTLTKSYGGYSASWARRMVKEQGQAKFIEELKKEKSSWHVTSAAFSHLEDQDISLDIAVELTTSDFITSNGVRMYLKPMLSEGRYQNPFIEESRFFPIDFGFPQEDTFIATFQIPAGYKVTDLPAPANINLPGNGGRFTYSVSVDNNRISVASRVQLRKPIYPVEEYTALRRFYDQIIAKHLEQIVLIKSN